jgi:chromosome segregation ATPase
MKPFDPRAALAEKRQRRREAVERLVALAVSLVAGTDVAAEDVDRACDAAGVSVERFVELMKVLQDRKAAADSTALAEIDQAEEQRRKNYRDLAAELDESKAAIEAITQRIRTIHQQQDHLRSLESRLKEQRSEATNVIAKALADSQNGFYFTSQAWDAVDCNLFELGPEERAHPA